MPRPEHNGLIVTAHPVTHDHNHILTAAYIRFWAVDNLVSCELVPSGKRLLLGPRQVGVRKRFYAGTRASDGTRTALPAEEARGFVENKAVPLMRDLSNRWPLRDAAERAWVAMWLAMTLCASPRARDRIPADVEHFFADLERDDPALAAVTAGDRSELSEPDFELDSMFEGVSTVASLLGQMHWTLLHFDRPRLVSSDHPITASPWVSDTSRWMASPNEFVLGSLEIRFAVNPTTALLLTWADRDDRLAARPGTTRHLHVYNHAAWEQAERHRFWQPGTMPEVHAEQHAEPISVDLFAGYDPKSDSARLDAALVWVERRLHAQHAGFEDRAVVTAWIEAADDGPRLIHTRHAHEHATAFSGFVL